jgi:hypothetical protein
MRIVSHTTPAPQLLKTALEQRERPPEGEQAGSDPTTDSSFSGKDRAIFAAVVLGAVLLCVLAIIHWRQKTAAHPVRNDVKLPAVSTRSVSEAPVVKTAAYQIHVSAISLGNPRMAIINGLLVGEGEQITLHPPAAPVAVTLQVRKISDGEIELSDGVQVIKARLELAPASKRKP